MLLDENQQVQLKAYLIHELEPICDADPIVLTDYVIALLKHDKPPKELYDICVEQLQEFLLPGETKPFVEKLFTSLQGLFEPLDMAVDQDNTRNRYRDERKRENHRQSPYQRRGRGKRIYQIHSNNPNADTLVIKNIPSENCTLDQVSDYFSQFGQIDDIQIQPEHQQAIVKFSIPASARDAHGSPKVIFGNRFVKVFWQAEERRQPEPENEELQKQKAIEIRNQLYQEQQEKMKTIAQKRADLIQKQLEEQKKLMAKLQEPNLGEEEKKQLLHSMKLLSESTKSMMASQTIPISSIGVHQEVVETDDMQQDVDPALAAELETLKKEATSLGIPAIRGRGRGRGGRFNLDNRTTKFIIPIPSDVVECTKHYQAMPGFKSLQVTGNGAVVYFYNRQAAEWAIIRPPPNCNGKINWYVTQ